MEYTVRKTKSTDIVTKLGTINLDEMKEKNEGNKGTDLVEMSLSDWEVNRAVGIRNRVADNTGRTLFDINHSDIFLDLSPKSKEAKAKKKQMEPN